MEGCSASPFAVTRAPCGIRLKRSRARVADLIVRQKDLEEASALDGEVQRIASAAQVALGLDDLGIARSRAPVPTCKPEETVVC